MSELHGSFVSSSIEDDREVMVFDITARSEGAAKRRANRNMTVKGRRNSDTEDVELIEEKEDSSRGVYRVEVSARR